MRLKAFTLRLDPATGLFDDGAMEEHLAGREVMDVYEHLFHQEGEPVWAILVTCRDAAGTALARGTPDREDPRKRLSRPDRELFDALRRWRNVRAAREGRPAYVLFTNRQLAAIATARPGSLEALREVEGVGEARARRSPPRHKAELLREVDGALARLRVLLPLACELLPEPAPRRACPAGRRRRPRPGR